MRGRLWMAGVRATTGLSDVLDVLEVVLMDTPQEALTKKRRKLDLMTAAAQARAGMLDRDTWGMAPEQQSATRRLMGGGG